MLRGGRGEKHKMFQIATFPIIFVTDFRGRTSLLKKDKSKGNVGSNYRRITYIMWNY